ARDSILIFSSYIVTLLMATLCAPLLITSTVTVPVSSTMNTWGSSVTFVTMTCAAAVCCSTADTGRKTTITAMKKRSSSARFISCTTRQGDSAHQHVDHVEDIDCHRNNHSDARMFQRDAAGLSDTKDPDVRAPDQEQ